MHVQRSHGSTHLQSGPFQTVLMTAQGENTALPSVFNVRNNKTPVASTSVTVTPQAADDRGLPGADPPFPNAVHESRWLCGQGCGSLPPPCNAVSQHFRRREFFLRCSHAHETEQTHALKCINTPGMCQTSAATALQDLWPSEASSPASPRQRSLP